MSPFSPPRFFRETGIMAPDTFTLEPEPEAESIHRDRLGELRDRLDLLKAESDRIARGFVRLHGLRVSMATPGADLAERIDQLIMRHEADILRTHSLLHDAANLLTGLVQPADV